jgi:ABC-2 type transport system ATP-binding protein
MSNIIEVENFTRRYGDFTAVNDISFAVEEGSMFGFLGPNGAGKTTTINTLCTILGKTDGQMRINGHDVDRERDAVRKDIGIVFQESTLDSKLTVEENLRFHCEFYQVQRNIISERIDSVLDLVELRDWRDSPVAGLSGGMKRRVEIARGLVHYPKVLFLDEPTAGLDPQARASVWTYIKRVQEEQGITIFLTTHYMDEAEICSSISIMNKGRIAASGSPEALEALFARSVLVVETNGAARLSAYLSGSGIPFTVEGDRFRITADSIRSELEILSSFRDSIESYSTDRGSLDEVFLAIADGKNAAGDFSKEARI